MHDDPERRGGGQPDRPGRRRSRRTPTTTSASTSSSTARAARTAPAARYGTREQRRGQSARKRHPRNQRAADSHGRAPGASPGPRRCPSMRDRDRRVRRAQRVGDAPARARRGPRYRRRRGRRCAAGCRRRLTGRAGSTADMSAARLPAARTRGRLHRDPAAAKPIARRPRPSAPRVCRPRLAAAGAVSSGPGSPARLGRDRVALAGRPRLRALTWLPEPVLVPCRLLARSDASRERRTAAGARSNGAPSGWRPWPRCTWAAAGSVLASDSSIPIANMVSIRDEPPKEISGSGIPVIGSSPTTAPMLISACPTSQAVMAAATSRPNGIGRALRDPDAAVGQHAEQHDDQQRADQAELLADDRQDEVGVRVRQVGPLLPAGAEADAPPAAGGKRVQTLHRLPSGVLRVLEGVGERGEPRQPVRLGDREVGDQHADHAPAGRRTAGPASRPPRAGSSGSRRCTSVVPRSGSSITSPASSAGDRQQRDQQVAPLTQPPLLAHQQVGAPQREGELGELAGLERERTDPDPAGGAVGGHPDARAPAPAAARRRATSSSGYASIRSTRVDIRLASSSSGQADRDPHQLLDEDRERRPGRRRRT